MPLSSSRAPDASTLPSVEVRPATGRTCTHSSYHACPCARFLSGGVLGPALPSPSFPVHAAWHVHALRGYVKAGACAHDSACERMRMRTENACSTRLVRSDGSVVCTCTCREHAACIRRSLQAGACGNNSAGEQMRTRTQDACALFFIGSTYRRFLRTSPPLGRLGRRGAPFARRDLLPTAHPSTLGKIKAAEGLGKIGSHLPEIGAQCPITFQRVPA